MTIKLVHQFKMIAFEDNYASLTLRANKSKTIMSFEELEKHFEDLAKDIRNFLKEKGKEVI